MQRRAEPVLPLGSETSPPRDGSIGTMATFRRRGGPGADNERFLARVAGPVHARRAERRGTQLDAVCSFWGRRSLLRRDVDAALSCTPQQGRAPQEPPRLSGAPRWDPRCGCEAVST